MFDNTILPNQDQIMLAFVEMQIEIDYPEQILDEMTWDDLAKVAMEEFIKEFLIKKIENKLDSLHNFEEEENEAKKYLAYLQIGKNLGIILQDTEVFFPTDSSFIDEFDIRNIEDSFFACDLNLEVAKQILYDNLLNLHPEVRQIINMINTEQLDPSYVRPTLESDIDQSSAKIDARDYLEHSITKEIVSRMRANGINFNLPANVAEVPQAVEVMVTQSASLLQNQQQASNLLP